MNFTASTAAPPIPIASEVYAQLVNRRQTRDEERAKIFVPREYDERNNDRIEQSLLLQATLAFPTNAYLTTNDDHGMNGALVSVVFDCPILAAVDETSKVATQMHRVFVERVVPVLQRAGWTIDSLAQHNYQNIGDGITMGPDFVCCLKYCAD